MILPEAIPEPILAERRRQIEREGWSPEQDDRFVGGELLRAAAVYHEQAVHGGVRLVRRPTAYPSRHGFIGRVESVPLGWPWAARWWKPRGPRRDLERAGALCLAEIERLRRCSQPAQAAEAKLRQILKAWEALPA